MKEMKITLGKKFSWLRLQAGRTEAETAALLKTQVDTYIKLEEDFLYPSESMINKVARLYSLTYNELLGIGE